MIIDVHQHYLPVPPYYADEPLQDWLYAGSRVQGYRDIPALCDDMDAAGISRIIWQGEYLTQPANCRSRNRAVARLVAQYPTRFGAFASVPPQHPDAIAIAQAARADGLSGVGEINPAAQHFGLRDPQVLRFFAWCEAHAVPVLAHVNEPVGPAYPGKTTTDIRFWYECAARFPGLRLILAHWGGGLWWYEQIPAVRAVLANVWYDSAAAFFTYPDAALIARFAAELIPHKVLFGSDYPLRPPSQPDGWLQTWTQQFAAAAPAEYRDAWLGTNAAALLATRASVQEQVVLPPGTGLLNMATPLVRVAEVWPDRLPVLARWGIHVDEHTPWWQTLTHALSVSGHRPDAVERFRQELGISPVSRPTRPDHD